MIIKSEFWIDGFLPEEPFNSNTTGELYLDTDNRNFYLDIFDDETDKLITRVYLDDILNALCDIIR